MASEEGSSNLVEYHNREGAFTIISMMTSRVQFEGGP